MLFHTKNFRKYVNIFIFVLIEIVSLFISSLETKTLLFPGQKSQNRRVDSHVKKNMGPESM